MRIHSAKACATGALCALLLGGATAEAQSPPAPRAVTASPSAPAADSSNGRELLRRLRSALRPIVAGTQPSPRLIFGEDNRRLFPDLPLAIWQRSAADLEDLVLEALLRSLAGELKDPELGRIADFFLSSAGEKWFKYCRDIQKEFSALPQAKSHKQKRTDQLRKYGYSSATPMPPAPGADPGAALKGPAPFIAPSAAEVRRLGRAGLIAGLVALSDAGAFDEMRKATIGQMRRFPKVPQGFWVDWLAEFRRLINVQTAAVFEKNFDDAELRDTLEFWLSTAGSRLRVLRGKATLSDSEAAALLGRFGRAVGDHYKVACAGGDPEACFREGMGWSFAGWIPEAEKVFKAGCERGSKAACKALSERK